MSLRTVFITGASAGMGRALALRLAHEGATVALSARRSDELAKVQREIEARGGKAHVYPLDVSDTAAVRATLQRADDELSGLDMVIANAGVANNRRAHKFRWDECERMLQVNVLGAAATLTAVLDRMVERKRGHVVGVSSLAGVRALPGMSAYGGSKAFLSRFLEGLRIDLEPYGITVTDVRPGFVESEMTARYKQTGQAMPFLMRTEDAAERIARGLLARERVITFPWQMSTLLKGVAWVPEPLWQKGVRKFM